MLRLLLCFTTEAFPSVFCGFLDVPGSWGSGNLTPHLPLSASISPTQLLYAWTVHKSPLWTLSKLHWGQLLMFARKITKSDLDFSVPLAPLRNSRYVFHSFPSIRGFQLALYLLQGLFSWTLLSSLTNLLPSPLYIPRFTFLLLPLVLSLCTLHIFFSCSCSSVPPVCPQQQRGCHCVLRAQWECTPAKQH